MTNSYRKDPPSTEYYRAAVVRSALNLLIQDIRPNSGYTLKSVLAVVSKITGKSYRISKIGAMIAIQDLTIWMDQARKEKSLAGFSKGEPSIIQKEEFIQKKEKPIRPHSPLKKGEVA